MFAFFLQIGSPSTEPMWPAPGLRSQAVRSILAKNLVGPTVQNGWNVSAFRMGWIKQDDQGTRNLWDQIVQLRYDLDQLVQTLPGLVYFVSAVTATSSQQKTNTSSSTNVKAHPGVSYWLVSHQQQTDSRQLYTVMHNNRLGANLKLQLQPYQQSEKQYCHALYNTVKDNMEGCVRRLFDASARTLSIPLEAIVKIIVADQEATPLLTEAVSQLGAVRFHAELLHMS